MNNEPLTQIERSFTAFALFSLAMRTGPSCFPAIVSIISKLDIEAEFHHYGADWIAHAQKLKGDPARTDEPKTDPAYEHWLAGLTQIVAAVNGTNPPDVFIDGKAAKEYYLHGYTPLQAYEEGWHADPEKQGGGL